MLSLLKYLIQLILSPGEGWKELRQDAPDASALQRRGLYPLLAVMAATELLGFVYLRHATVAGVLMRMLADFGAYFVALFIARLLLGLYLPHLCMEKPDESRIATFAVCGIGLMVLVQTVCNCLPWNLVLLRFLPVYVILVLYKATDYLGVRDTDKLRFVGLAAASIVAVPLLLFYLLYFLIP